MDNPFDIMRDIELIKTRSFLKGILTGAILGSVVTFFLRFS